MTNEKDSIAGLLAKTRPFSAAPSEEIEALAASCSISDFSSGTHVFLEGERAASSWLVWEGRVRILNFGAGARSLQVERLGPGELFGLYCRLAGGAVHLCTAVADGPLRAVCIPDRPFAALRRRDLPVSRCTVECCAARMRVLKRAIGFGRESVSARVVDTLLALREQFGDDVPATRHALSVWIGAAQETVFRVLARLRARGLVSTSRGRVRILDAKGLAKLRGDAR
ncbi:MAG: Crp/Fnr family transcriptional regulator [Elusimicrobiota bacterium]